MPTASFLAIAIDSSRKTPLFQQVYEALRTRILAGEIAVGAPLPATRNLARELGIARSTVILAYDQLIAEGYAESRRGSGVYVCELAGMVAPLRPQTIAHRTDTVTGPATRQTRPFEPGLPDMRLFPYRKWSRCLARVARLSPEALIDSDSSFGDPPLRQAIARHLEEWRGIETSAEQIIITAGAGDALELTIRALVKSGDVIALENPGYPPLRRFAQSLGLNTHWLDVGSSGAEPPKLDTMNRPPALYVLTPSHQFPLGGTMAPKARAEFLKLAEATGSWIIEDDFDSEFRYAGRPIPALAGLDRSGRVIYVGSFSKIFSSSLRLGFMTVPEALVSDFANTLAAFGQKASIAAQRPLATFIDEGEFHRHIRRMRRVYGTRRKAFVELLAQELGGLVSFEDHPAGMQLATILPPRADDAAISQAAAAEGVLCPPLSQYYAGVPKHKGLLMGFTAFAEDEMQAPMRKLREIMEADCQLQPPIIN